MASSRATTSAVSLEDWDTLAPLSDNARASVDALDAACSERPIPTKLAKLQSANVNTAVTINGSRPSTPSRSFLRRPASRVEIAGLVQRSDSPVANGLDDAKHATSNKGRPLPHSSNNATSLLSSSALSPTAPSRHHSRTTSAVSIGSGLGLTSEPLQANHSHHRGSEYASDVLDIDAPIESTQQFLDWYGRVEGSMESEQEQVFRRYSAEVNAYIDSCSDALEVLEDSRGLIKEMEANYHFVEENSKALQQACEAMLIEQKHLLTVTEAIDSRLQYFRELDTATRALSQPGDVVVLQDDFLPMLQRLDQSLDFMKANRNYRDAEVYLIRFQQCLTRAMTLIKMHFVSTLQTINTDVTSRLNAASTTTGRGPAIANLSDAARDALVYAKFSSNSEALRVLLYELERRAALYHEEYGNLLQECLNAWISVRHQLIGPIMAEEVRRMESGAGTADVIRIARTGCAYLRTVCISEWTLFRSLFSIAGARDMHRYLETICDYLYDSLRPKILHEPRLDVLCELCTVLQALISLDEDAENPQESLASDIVSNAKDVTVSFADLDRSSTVVGNDVAVASTTRGLRFADLLRAILQDTQTRLVFRAQYIMEADVFNYVPKDTDLDYPAKLKSNAQSGIFSLGREGKETEASARRDDEDNTSLPWKAAHGHMPSMGLVDVDGALSFKLPPESTMEDWYPSLRKTLWVLSKLHSYVDSAVFEDFAGEAVTLCRQSLTGAAEKVSSRTNASRLDGQLFAVRHLLILKETVRSVDLIQIDRGVDFTSTTEALTSLLRNTSTLFNPNALFQLATKGMPTFTETMRDAKRELDSTLKLVCEDFMTQSSLLIASSIRAFLTRCQTFLTSHQAKASSPNPNNASTAIDGNGLSDQSWATPSEVIKLHDIFVAEGAGQVGSFEAGMHEILQKLRLYLDDEQTVAVLVPPIQGDVLDHYTTLFNLVRSEYDAETSGHLIPPSRLRDRFRAYAATGQGEMDSLEAGLAKQRLG